MLVRLAFAASSAVLCASCATAVPIKVPAEPVAATRIDRGPESVESDIGGMNLEAVEEVFDAVGAELGECVLRGSSEIETLGGQIQIALRISREGHARSAYLRESTLGDRKTERCVLDVLRRQRWPRPLGGEGLAERSLTVEPRREAAELPADRGSWIVERARSGTVACRTGIEGSFRATAYLRPDGSVLAAGVAPPSARGEEASDCIVEALERLRFAGIGRPVKISFELKTPPRPSSARARTRHRPR